MPDVDQHFENAMTADSAAGSGPLCAGEAKSSLLCPICARREWRFALRVRFSRLYECRHCGLLATGDFLFDKRHPSDLYEVGPENHAAYLEYYLPKRLPVYRRILPRLERFRRSGRLLEVGSSYGYFLELAGRAHWRAEGVELSSYPSTVARSKGCTVFCGKLQDMPAERGSYDVIVMWDVIEHLSDVGEIAESIFGLLRSGGALVARTPDARALHQARGIMGAGYRHLAYPANAAEHVFHFTPENLALLLQKKDFRRTETDRDASWEERIIGGRNAFIRMSRWLIFRYAFLRQWPYEFVITAVKP